MKERTLAKLAEEDPTFVISTNEDTGQTIISGMGELHLDILIDRLVREFKVHANIGTPWVAYKETVSAKQTGEGKFIRQSGGKGQYGHVILSIEPCKDSIKPIFENKTIKKIAQNIKFDTMILRQHGIFPQNLYFDTMVAAYLVDSSTSQHSLDNLAQEYLNYKTIKIEEGTNRFTLRLNKKILARLHIILKDNEIVVKPILENAKSIGVG